MRPTLAAARLSEEFTSFPDHTWVLGGSCNNHSGELLWLVRSSAYISDLPAGHGHGLTGNWGQRCCWSISSLLLGCLHTASNVIRVYFAEKTVCPRWLSFSEIQYYVYISSETAIRLCTLTLYVQFYFSSSREVILECSTTTTYCTYNVVLLAELNQIQ